MSYQPRHLRRRDDRRLGGWLVTIGLFVLVPALGAALAGPYLFVAR